MDNLPLHHKLKFEEVRTGRLARFALLVLLLTDMSAG